MGGTKGIRSTSFSFNTATSSNPNHTHAHNHASTTSNKNSPKQHDTDHGPHAEQLITVEVDGCDTPMTSISCDGCIRRGRRCSISCDTSLSSSSASDDRDIDLEKGEGIRMTFSSLPGCLSCHQAPIRGCRLCVPDGSGSFHHEESAMTPQSLLESDEKDPVLLSVLSPAAIIDDSTIPSPTWNYAPTEVNDKVPIICDEDEEGFGEDTEHIDFTALKGFLNVFRPNPNEDISDNKKGKYVFYSLQTGLLRHHNLADVGRTEGVRNLGDVMRSGPFWLDICNPSPAELRALCEIFKVHPLTLEGLESEGEEIREKCDVFEKYYFISIRAFDSDARSADYLLPINLFLLVSPSCVVSIHYDPLEFSHTIAKRMRLLTARTGLTSDWIVYTILEDVLEMFVPTIRSVEKEVDEIEDAVGGGAYLSSILQRNTHPTVAAEKRALLDPEISSQSEFLGRISQARKRVTQLIRLISAKSDLFRVISKRCSSRFHEDAHLYLRDLQDHTAMVDQSLHHYDESLNRSHANYLAHISIEISETSNTMNDVMKKLTAISTVTLPWTMFSGLMAVTSFDAYWAPMVFMMTLASVAIYFVGRRRDWF